MVLMRIVGIVIIIYFNDVVKERFFVLVVVLYDNMCWK